MNATAQQQDAIAHNLAHSIKPGYLRELVRFDASCPESQIQGPSTSLHTDFSPGTMQRSGNPLTWRWKGLDSSQCKAQRGQPTPVAVCSN